MFCLSLIDLKCLFHVASKYRMNLILMNKNFKNSPSQCYGLPHSLSR